MPEAVLSLQALWESAGAVLAAASIPEPRREAIRLWSDLERTPSARAVLERAEPVGAERAERFLAAVGRRAAGEPLAYVTGWTGFRHLELACDRRALIPRPETEELVGRALALTSRGVAADIGTGTGAIALSLATEGGFDRVIGTDLSPDALALATENGVCIGARVEWRLGDLLAPLAGESVDLLVSNPPYLTAAELRALDASVAAWEPHLALASGADGLDAVRGLLDGARSVVRSGGWLALELDCHRAPLVASLAESLGWREVGIHQDLFGRDRFCTARWEG
jgi:release factor glutamine methyltransferase